MILMGSNGFGFFVTMMLVAMSLELAIPLALFAGFVSEFIPAVGTYIGAAVPIVVALVALGLVQALVILGTRSSTSRSRTTGSARRSAPAP
jgi:predicted PurR-regulated permease PerM